MTKSAAMERAERLEKEAAAVWKIRRQNLAELRKIEKIKAAASKQEAAAVRREAKRAATLAQKWEREQ